MPASNSDIVAIIIEYFPEVFDVYDPGPHGCAIKCIDFDTWGGFTFKLMHTDGIELVNFVRELEHKIDDQKYNFDISVDAEDTSFVQFNFYVDAK